ncbi:phosphopantetheine-binding protein [Streptomyces sp. ISL-11]|uniref:phosphopantetheine-binding protein n=1 Tax=Streptomyces sp. ISL-11 TaxID=2819174 RepID=UPI001BE8FDAF|nr:phosphopantetheine-binding protein [Streptomyces sp. ISL-11]MBT2383219.1 acyl carrier protein [Streptomyces sp. ISL-11]
MDARFTEILTPFLPYLNDHPLTDETPLREFGLDSMQAIELMFAVEDTFGVELPDELLTEETFSTAGKLWGAVSGAMPEAI